jgi:hypothetical protein
VEYEEIIKCRNREKNKNVIRYCRESNSKALRIKCWRGGIFIFRTNELSSEKRKHYITKTQASNEKM